MTQTLVRRLLTAAVAALALTAAFTLAGQLAPPPATAATKAAGIPGLTPDGGYLGNYLAPDGAKVYCIDSPLPWPEGQTSAPTLVDSLVTTWGAVLAPEAVRKLNYVLLTYGQTDDPVQAAAVAAFVNAYTSGWARDLGAGREAGAWYLNGNPQVTAVYDGIWADAEAHAAPVGTATVQITMADPLSGVVTVASSLPEATGTLVLHGAVAAETGQAQVAVAAAGSTAIRGTPGEGEATYAVSAEVSYTAPTPAEPTLLLYTTADQQRTIRGGTTGSVAFGASAQTGALVVPPPPVPPVPPAPPAPPAPPQLAATGRPITGTAALGTGLAGVALIILGGVLGISARRRRWSLGE